jgi:ABC-type glycerol-3-phosphate transport system permease component
MKKNIGKFDFYIRIIIGIVSGYFAYSFEFTDWKSFVFVGLTLLMFFTATLKFCPLYYLLNTNSFKIDL